jgi:RecA/RadA recombinase
MFINTATRFPSESMRLAGVDTSRLFYLDSASYGDDLLTHARELLYDKEKGCARNIVDILVIDDVTGLVPKSEVEAVDEEGFEKATVGRHAALLSKFLRHVAGLGCLRHGGNLILCNQERLDVGSYGNPRKQTGGLAMEFWPRVILQLSKKPITSGSDKKAIGQEVHFTCDKLMFRRFDNPPEGSYRVIYGQGVDQSVEAVEEALDLGIIKKISVSDYELYNTEGKLLRLSKIESVRKYYQTQWEEQVALLDQIYALKGAASKPIIAAPLSAPKEAEPLTVMEAALLSETTPPKPKKK